MSYTNKEFVAQCLIEAAELLSESVGRNSAIEKYRNIKYGGKNPDDTWTKKMGKDIARDVAKQRDKKYGVFEKGKKKRDMKYIEEYIAFAKRNGELKKEILDDIRAEHDKTSDKKHNLNAIVNSNGKGNTNMYLRKKRLEARNESIDLSSLLREAADLLED